MVKVPERGDIISINLNPTAGHEQKGHRPALVISHSAFNKKTGLAIICPITSSEKGYPFEVPFDSKKIHGVILADQVRTIDFKARNSTVSGKVSPFVLQETVRKLSLTIQ